MDQAASHTGFGRRATLIIVTSVAAAAAAYVALRQAPDRPVLLDFTVSSALMLCGMIALARLSSESTRRTRERLRADIDALQDRRKFEAEFDRALDLHDREEDVLSVARAALERVDPERLIEIHLVDPAKPLLSLVTTTFTKAQRPEQTRTWSPWESVAIRQGQSVIYETTDRLDVCQHLQSRIIEPCSAVCIPLSVQGRMLGVLYALGPNQSVPPQRSIEILHHIASRTAIHVALTRTLSKDGGTSIDHLTGLPDRRAGQARLNELSQSSMNFSIAVCRIDDFLNYSDRFGQNAVERALRKLADTLTRTVRPSDFVCRLGNEDFLVILPLASSAIALRVVERIRETIILTQATKPDPAFSCSFGVANSANTASAEEVMTLAAQALGIAQSEGRNRVKLSTSPVTPLTARSRSQADS